LEVLWKVAVGLGGPFGSHFYIQGLEFFNKKERQDAKRMKKWKVAVGLGGSFWEPFLCTRAGVFQQKRKKGCKKDEQVPQASKMLLWHWSCSFF
jgi:hypothetical protein